MWSVELIKQGQAAPSRTVVLQSETAEGGEVTQVREIDANTIAEWRGKKQKEIVQMGQAKGEKRKQLQEGEQRRRDKTARQALVENTVVALLGGRAYLRGHFNSRSGSGYSRYARCAHV